MLKVAVVVPLFNKVGTVGRCLRGIMAQTIKVNEILVVDDGSTDGGGNVALECLEGVEGAQVIVQENQGVSAARNTGIAQSKADLVFLCDADDEWLPHHVETICGAARVNPDCDIYTTTHSVNGLGVQTIPRVVLRDTFAETYRSSRGLICSSSVAINRELWRSWPGFPVGVKRGEDMFVWLLVGSKGKIEAIDKHTVRVYKDRNDGRHMRVGEVPYILVANEILNDSNNYHFLRRHAVRILLMAEIDRQPQISQHIKATSILPDYLYVSVRCVGRMLAITKTHTVAHKFYRSAKRILTRL